MEDSQRTFFRLVQASDKGETDISCRRVWMRERTPEGGFMCLIFYGGSSSGMMGHGDIKGDNVTLLGRFHRNRSEMDGQGIDLLFPAKYEPFGFQFWRLGFVDVPCAW
jgi:hypothetical protein